MVWCHERCRKAENTDLRHALSGTLQKSRGSLICFKLARNFLQWQVGREARIPYVLVCDWRQTQPCVNEMVKEPALLVVVCDSARQEKRAQRWAASAFMGSFPVWVLFNGSAPPRELPLMIEGVPSANILSVVVEHFASVREHESKPCSSVIDQRCSGLPHVMQETCTHAMSTGGHPWLQVLDEHVLSEESGEEEVLEPKTIVPSVEIEAARPSLESEILVPLKLLRTQEGELTLLPIEGSSSAA